MGEKKTTQQGHGWKKPSKVMGEKKNPTQQHSDHHKQQACICAVSHSSALILDICTVLPSHHWKTRTLHVCPHTFLRQPWQEVSVLSICRSSSTARTPGARALRHTPQTGFFGFRHSCRHAEQKLEQDIQRTCHAKRQDNKSGSTL